MNEKGKLVTRTAKYQIRQLPKEMRDNLERTGVCLSCYREIPEGKFDCQIIS